ncbi:kinase-like protein [Trametopsis cervina]|nr:kinase-like protein [Trametopsis cervina]
MLKDTPKHPKREPATFHRTCKVNFLVDIPNNDAHNSHDRLHLNFGDIVRRCFPPTVLHLGQPRNARLFSHRFPENYLLHAEFLKTYVLRTDFVCDATPNGFLMKARCLGSICRFMVKFVEKTRIPQDGWVEGVLGRVPQEIVLASSIGHPYITDGEEKFFEDATYVYIEIHGPKWFPGGGNGNTVQDFMQYRRILSQDIARDIFKQLASAVAILHVGGVSHCDLRLINISIDEGLRVKIIDFGNAVRDSFVQHDYEDFEGNMNYAPPEVQDRGTYQTAQADVWSLGVILSEMVTNQFILEPMRQAPDVIAYNIGHVCNDGALSSLLGQLLCVDPKERITMMGVIEHPWLCPQGRQERGRRRA